MADIISCPTCANQLRVPQKLVGQTVKCPSCGAIFAAMAPEIDVHGDQTAAAEYDFQPAPRPKPRQEEIGPRRETQPDGPAGLRPCPQCGRENPAEHIACNHCGAVFEDYLVVADDYGGHAIYRGDYAPHRGGLILCLGILSIAFGITILLSFIGVVLGLSSWIMGQRDLERIRERAMDPRGDGLTHSGWICGIVGTFISMFTGLCCFGYLLIALIIGAL